MELAGLEPPPSWVRFGRLPSSNSACLQGFLGSVGRCGGAHMLGVCRHFTGVKATEPGFWPPLVLAVGIAKSDLDGAFGAGCAHEDAVRLVAITSSILATAS